MNQKCTINLVRDKEIKNIQSTFDGVIGQAPVIKKLSFFLQSHNQNSIFPSMLFTGSHGLGKTYLATKLAHNLHRDLVMVNCGEIKDKKDFIEKILLMIVAEGRQTTLFMDESHRLSKDIETILLTLINPNESGINVISYKGFEIEYDMKFINMIFATTDAYEMFSPLKNRCIPIYFYPYSEETVIEMLQYYLEDIKLCCNLHDLAYACRGRARDVFLLSQNIKRYCDLKKVKNLCECDWNEIKDIFDINYLGLTREEVMLLDAIAQHEPISCANLALKLMVNEKNVKSELEVRPRELGLIENSTMGRILTKEGREYIKKVEKC